MRRIVAAGYLSLDGVTEDLGPAGAYEHRGWTLPYWNHDIEKLQTDQLYASDAPLLGRVTFDEFAASWPLRSGDPFTDRMNSLPRFIASTTLQEPLKWNSTLIKGDAAHAAADLKQQSGEDILIYGSGTLVNTLIPRNLIDEYRFNPYLGDEHHAHQSEPGQRRRRRLRCSQHGAACGQRVRRRHHVRHLLRHDKRGLPHAYELSLAELAAISLAGAACSWLLPRTTKP
jgi:dihydrofolate reductase